MSNKPIYTVENNKEMVDSLNTLLESGLLLGSNFAGQIIENIELPSGTDFAISHNLKKTPKYRIILRNSSQAIISDGNTSLWDDKKIYLRASASTTVTILLMKG